MDSLVMKSPRNGFNVKRRIDIQEFHDNFKLFRDETNCRLNKLDDKMGAIEKSMIKRIDLPKHFKEIDRNHICFTSNKRKWPEVRKTLLTSL